MKFKTTKTSFLKAIGQSGLASGKRSTLPALNHLLVRVDKQKATITGTDLKVTITSEFEAEAQEPGALCLPAKLLGQFMAMQQEEIAVELQKNRVRICGGSFAFIAAEEFAVDAALKEKPLFTIGSAALLDALSRVRSAMAAEHPTERPALQATLLDFDKGLHVIACDGRHLIQVDAPDVKGKDSLSLPIHLIEHLVPLLKQSDCDLRVSENNNFIQVEADDWRVVGRKTEFEYPKWRSIIPADFKHDLVFDRAELMALTQQCSLFVNQAFNPAIKMSFKKGWMEVVCGHGDNSFEGRIKCETKTIPDFTIAIPPDHVLEALRAVAGEKVTLKLIDTLSPAALVEPNFLAIITPMRNV